MTIPMKVRELYHSAMPCELCFKCESNIRHAFIDVPQPRYIGKDYFSAKKKILTLMINPGTRKPTAQGPEKDLLYKFKEDKNSLEDYFEFQQKDMLNWGRGHFINYFKTMIGLNMDEVAFANIAWCSIKGNNYTAPVLNNCFKLHTQYLVKEMNPDIVLLSGSPTWLFSGHIHDLLPNAKVLEILHYANQKPLRDKKNHVEYIKEVIKECT